MSERVRKVLRKTWVGVLFLAIPVLFWYGLNHQNVPRESESLGQILLWALFGTAIIVVCAAITVFLSLPRSGDKVNDGGA